MSEEESLGRTRKKGRGQLIDRATVETCGVEKNIYINEEIFINKIIIIKYYLNKLECIIDILMWSFVKVVL